MSYSAIIAKIAEKSNVDFALDFPVGLKTAYKTGGKADGVLFPSNSEQMKSVVYSLKESDVPYVVMGCGSNVLVSDRGYKGAVIFSENLKNITVRGKTIVAEAGVSLSELIKTALYSGLGGLEFLSGIPASVGGAVAMNAGAYGKSTGDYVSYVVTTSGVAAQKTCGFDYRTSVFKRENLPIISACFMLENAEFDQSEEKIDKYLKLRQKKTPKGRSCGSVFKNDGYFAGKIIEEAKLKGAREGGAYVSEKHANFIIADKTATSGDIKRLIDRIKRTVRGLFGTELSEEVEYIGEFDEQQ